MQQLQEAGLNHLSPDATGEDTEKQKDKINSSMASVGRGIRWPSDPLGLCLGTHICFKCKQSWNWTRKQMCRIKHHWL